MTPTMTPIVDSRIRERARSAVPLSCAFLILIWGLAGASAFAEDAHAEAGFPDEEDWPEMDLEARIAAVSDGELRFVGPERAAATHRHVNRIRIGAESLREGWIELTQCHENLDAVGAAQIIFSVERIRGLEVVSAQGIGRAWVEGPSVQLTDIAPGARLCIRAESRAMFALGDGRYRLRNGPYMRRFLDGYYPMQVVLDVSYPADRLALVHHQPATQPGFAVRAGSGHVAVDAAFEGRLFTCLDFCETGSSDCELAITDCAE
ncbi:alpha/beta hydrolase [Thiocapsa sp.]|uniref:alpha/beta hydrolase n=1 Tax=Thiocapsa sp. TaxID=2024551 RepID=UPI0025E4C430|nr:alpha/beta hydrolase [Thiocapsa sp.]